MWKSWMTRAVLGRTSVGGALRPASRPDAAFEATWRCSFKGRLLTLMAGIFCWAGVLEARLVYLQVVKHDEFKAAAKKQQEDVIKLDPGRGDIRDRNGELLAYSVESYRVIADPSLVKDPRQEVQEICAALMDCTFDERAQMEKRLSAKSQYALIRNSRALSPKAAMRLQELIRERVKQKKAGVLTLFPESRRYYPNRMLAAHVVGAVGADGKGVSGLENKYETTIAGQSGLVRVMVDAGQQEISSVIERAATAGASIELTLDLRLQHIAEKELAATMKEYRALGGAVIIMDPHTGEILAQASYPTFNPNDSGSFSDADRRNRTVQDTYEPGSTFKIITAAAALNEGVLTARDLIDTNPGYVKIQGRKPIREAQGHKYGVLTVEDVVAKSSNVGAIRIGERLGGDRLLEYVHRFGFDQKNAPDFKGDSRGQLGKGPLDESSRASISMGYQIGITPLQLATATSVIANGGLLVEPRVLRAIVNNGQRAAVEPKILRRVLTPETASTMTAILQSVVEKGTAKAAALSRYRVAGKTGTASRLDENRRYSETDYNVSFVGFVPSEKPALTILVIVERPQAARAYGGTIAAPLFKRVAEASLQQLGVTPSINPAAPIISGAPSLLPAAPAVLEQQPLITRVGGRPVMPDMTGLSLREAIRVANELGMYMTPQGDGTVVAQMPQPGEFVESGRPLIVQLQRHPPAPRGGR
jgi:cell division protein FtsI (penicillin-binding protein 3)